MNRARGNEAARPGETGSPLSTKADRPPGSHTADATAESLVPGTIVAERYRIVSVLGKGGSGQVYRADDLRLDQPVALKFLPEAVAGEPHRRERLLDEVRLARQITHPNICRIYDVVEDEGLSFISMEYIDGEDLATLLKRIGRLPQDKAIALGLDLCAGLEAIHERGILHRDLKPANLMVDGEGRGRITDFGMAGWTGTPSVGGTPSYMAPEQWMDLGISQQSDLYSLGLVLYELFTGKRAFDRPRMAVLSEAPTPPSKLVKELDAAVEGVVLRCLEKDPRDRPPSARAVAAALGKGSERSWRPALGLEIPHRPHWVLEKKIGSGGFGEVWLATHVKTRDRRVFKFCYELGDLRTLQREVTLFRFLKEKLGERDDIVRILDWSFEEPPYFVESEYAACGNLLEWAEGEGGIAQVPTERRLEIVAEIAEALAAAHSVGVIHKDVKPTNVLISPAADGALGIRLTDFGVGSMIERGQLVEAGITALGLTDRDSGSSQPGGTRLYMAPEVLEGKTATVQADVYALGVMLYQMAVGDFSRVLTPSWQRDIDDELLREDIAAAVDGSPERRLGSARQLADRLRTLETRRVERGSRERSQRFLRAGTLAMGGLLLLTVVLGYHTRRVALEQARTKNLARVTLAGEWLTKDPTSAALILLEVDHPETTAFAASRMREALYEELALYELRIPLPLLSASLDPGGACAVLLAEDGSAWLADLDGSGEPRRLEGHGGAVVDAAFHPGGGRLLTASEDGTARIWDVELARESVAFESCDGPLRAAAFSPSGDRVVTTCKSGPIRIRNLEGADALGEPLEFSCPQGPAFSASFSPDGSRLLSVSEDCVEIWDAGRTDRPLFLFPRQLRPHISSASFSPDGGYLAVVYSDLVEVWSLDGSGRRRVLGRHDGPVSSVVFSPDGERLLTASEDTTARVWQLHGETAEPVVLAGHRGRVASAAFSPDGGRIVTSSTDGTARVWSLGRGEHGSGAAVTRKVMKTDEALISAVFEPSGERLVTVSREGTLRVWNLTRPDVFVALRHEGPVSDASFSPRGERILTSSEDGTVRLWNADGSGEAVVLGDLRDVMRVTEASFSADGERILAVYEDLTVRSWPAQGPGEALFFERHLARSPVTEVAFDPGGVYLAAASQDGGVRIWDVGDADSSTGLGEHGGWVGDVAFSPAGDAVASASWDGTAKIWRIDGGVHKAVILAHESRVYALSFDSTGRRLATASADGRVRVWELFPLSQATVFRHDRLFRAPQFSPSGDLVVTVSQDGTARVGPADGIGKSFFLKGHTNSVVHASFSPDGRSLVTASRDGTARVWKVDGTGEAIVLRHDGPVNAASFSPTGDRVVTASQDGTARVWQLAGTSELLASIRSSTRVCLDPGFRVKVLGEGAEEARRRFARCRDESPGTSATPPDPVSSGYVRQGM